MQTGKKLTHDHFRSESRFIMLNLAKEEKEKMELESWKEPELCRRLTRNKRRRGAIKSLKPLIEADDTAFE